MGKNKFILLGLLALAAVGSSWLGDAHEREESRSLFREQDVRRYNRFGDDPRAEPYGRDVIARELAGGEEMPDGTIVIHAPRR